MSPDYVFASRQTLSILGKVGGVGFSALGVYYDTQNINMPAHRVGINAFAASLAVFGGPEGVVAGLTIGVVNTYHGEQIDAALIQANQAIYNAATTTVDEGVKTINAVYHGVQNFDDEFIRHTEYYNSDPTAILPFFQQ
ncbi:MAG: hypothetical protein K8F24_08710 [Bacteroidales bacterium]|nr:hypothetical protein [Bacteroidales bacterium]